MRDIYSAHVVLFNWGTQSKWKRQALLIVFICLKRAVCLFLSLKTNVTFLLPLTVRHTHFYQQT